MGNNKIVYYGETLIDLTSDTVAADKLLNGYTAHNKAGNLITGKYVDPLNYAVVGGTTAPSSPGVNTIWVNTSASITSYVFSSTQPASPSAGTVWFNIGTSASAPFNALKKNGIWVYPTNCKQYVSGAWVTKTAKTWNGSKWLAWQLALYNNGVKYGTWTDEKVGDGASGGSVTWNSATLKVIAAAVPYVGWNCTAYTYSELVDLSQYTSLQINAVSSGTNSRQILITSAKPSTPTGGDLNFGSVIAAIDIVSGNNTLDISAISSGYIVVAATSKHSQTAKSTLEISSIIAT